MRAKRKLVVALAIVLVVTAGVVALIRSRATGRPAEVRINPKRAPVVLTFPARVEARTVVDVPAPIRGVVDRLMAGVGEDVFEGELLARIQSSALGAAAQKAETEADEARGRVAELESGVIAARLEASRAQADATRAQAEFGVAEKTYQRQKLLVDEGATPRLVYEKAEADYTKLKQNIETFTRTAADAEARIGVLDKQLEAARKMADAKTQQRDESRADLGSGEVHSPVNGVVIARNGNVGDPIGLDRKDLFRIGTDLGSLQAVAGPDAATRAKLKPGQAADVQPADAPGLMHGRVRELRGGQVWIDFSSTLPAVKPGQAATVTIHLP